MPTTIATPGNSNTTIRYNEPYVSAGLNKKGVGSIPNGIVRGGLLSTTGAGLNVQVSPDPDTGDSVYVYTTPTSPPFQLTHRESATRTIDLSAVAGTTVYIALYVQYSIGSSTLVEWRAYSEAELFGGTPVAEAGSVVIVGKVAVPGVGPIPAANVTLDRARYAWKDVSPGVKPWKQIVKNGGFEDAGGTSVSPTTQGMPGFTAEEINNGNGGITDNFSPHSGAFEFRADIGDTLESVVFGPGAFTSSDPFSTNPPSVEAGQIIDASFWLRGDSVDTYTMGSSGARMVFEVIDDAGAIVETHSVDSDPSVHVGTFAYTQVDGMFQIQNRGYLRWYMTFSIDGGAGSGTFYVDDLAIYLSPGSNESLDQSAARLSMLELVPTGVSSALGMAHTMRMQFEGIGQLRLFDPIGNNPIQWISPIINAAIDIPDEDYGIIGANKGPQQNTTPTQYKLLHKYVSTNGDIRVYSGYNSSSTRPHLTWTLNAKWDNLAHWVKPLAGGPAASLEFNSNGEVILRQRAGIGSWTDNGWDTEQGVSVDANGDINYLTAVQRQRYVSLNLLANYSVQETGATPAPTARVVVGGHYLENASGNMGIYVPIHDFVPDGGQLIEVRFGMRGAAAGGGYDIRLERRSPDIATTPPVNTSPAPERVSQNDTWGPAALEDHITLSTNNNSAGGMTLPHVMDYSYEYRLFLEVGAAVGDFEMTYFLITYNDLGHG